MCFGLVGGSTSREKFARNARDKVLIPRRLQQITIIEIGGYPERG
jgi:hypothetical protein